ncbi:MAG: hypothetical protein K0R92_443 [Lachnospiraceae bacterium]|jgi:hypothetical protein|nr:hypothetical protein [Lachnospiraceae bacterium]
MSDLISRKALIKAMENKYDIANETGMYPTGLSEAFIITEKIIQEQPTAYDVDEVVEQLENSDSVQCFGSVNSGNLLIPVTEAVKILKGGLE